MEPMNNSYILPKKMHAAEAIGRQLSRIRVTWLNWLTQGFRHLEFPEKPPAPGEGTSEAYIQALSGGLPGSSLGGGREHRPHRHCSKLCLTVSRSDCITARATCEAYRTRCTS